MSRILIDPAAPSGKKFAGAPFGTFELWMRALAYAALVKTDGFVPAATLSQLAPGATRKQLQTCLAHLTQTQPGCANPSLHEVAGGYQIHDYDDPDYFNPTSVRERIAKETGAVGGKKSAESRRQKYGTARPRSVPAISEDEGSREGPPSEGSRRPPEGVPCEGPEPLNPSLTSKENNSAQRGSLDNPQTPFSARVLRPGPDPQLTEHAQTVVAAWEGVVGRTASTEDVDTAYAWLTDWQRATGDDIGRWIAEAAEHRRDEGQAPARSLRALHGAVRSRYNHEADDLPPRDRQTLPMLAVVGGHRSPTHGNHPPVPRVEEDPDDA